MGRRTETQNITGKPLESSANRFFGISTIYDREGQGTKYMTRIWIGRLRLHIFYRGDADPDCHDHPWDFWTFPLTSYVEEVVRPTVAKMAALDGPYGYAEGVEPRCEKSLQIVPALRLSFRPATHCHRVLGAYAGYEVSDASVPGDVPVPVVTHGKIVTLVWVSKPKRKWGFLKTRDGQWCWVDWRAYVFNGGKDGPCQ